MKRQLTVDMWQAHKHRQQAAGLRGEIQKHTSAVGELREELAESQRPAKSLVEVTEKLSASTEKGPSVSTGATVCHASSFEDMCDRDQAATTRTAVSSIKKTLQLASLKGDSRARSHKR